MKSLNSDCRGFASLIGTLLAIAIVCLMAYYVATNYLQKPSVDKETEKAVQAQGIDTSNYGSVLDSTKKKISDIQTQADTRARF